MTARIHRLPPASTDGKPGNRERLKLAQFAKRIQVTRQTVYKWAKYYPDRFPPGSLLRDPQGHFVVDWDRYEEGFTVVR